MGCQLNKEHRLMMPTTLELKHKSKAYKVSNKWFNPFIGSHKINNLNDNKEQACYWWKILRLLAFAQSEGSRFAENCLVKFGLS